MEFENQSSIIGYPNLISYECTQKIMKQMEECICKIYVGKEQGTAFLCKIPFPDKNNMLPVLITNNHVLKSDNIDNKEERIFINIKEAHCSKEINLGYKYRI